SHPLLGAGPLPIFPDAREREGLIAFHADGVGLLVALGAFPLEKVVDRHEAPALAVRIAERGKRSDRLRLSIDGFTAAFRLLHPMGDKAPGEVVERALGGLRMLPDDEEAL